MSIAVSLWSRRTGEIKKFLESFYEKQVSMDDDVEKWIYVYTKPLDAIDMISAVIDNNDKYQISMCIEMGQGDIYPVTYENHNDVIKGLLCLFYKEHPSTAC